MVVMGFLGRNAVAVNLNDNTHSPSTFFRTCGKRLTHTKEGFILLFDFMAFFCLLLILFFLLLASKKNREIFSDLLNEL